MNLEQVADELYALAPAAFTAARDEQAGQARASGDAELAGAIKKLRLADRERVAGEPARPRGQRSGG